MSQKELSHRTYPAEDPGWDLTDKQHQGMSIPELVIYRLLLQPRHGLPRLPLEVI